VTCDVKRDEHLTLRVRPLSCLLLLAAVCPAAESCYMPLDSWPRTLLTARERLANERVSDEKRTELVRAVWKGVERDFPVQWDWILQDFPGDFTGWFAATDTQIERQLIRKALAEPGLDAAECARRLEKLCQSNASHDAPAWLELYAQLCGIRRAARLEPLLRRYGRIVFTKHYNLGGSHYAYTEGQSDAQHERTFIPGSALCILELDGRDPRVITLIEDPDGVIRDPDVSYDGRRILFAWKQSDLEDDYHLYEMDVETREIRQLTFGLGVADYEAAYLPDGNIVFSSTRCVQTVDCWWTEVSNLYLCDGDGRHIRRVGFDQVHTNYPTVMDDGRVIYTRWEYNDRGQVYSQGLFQMNPDGTGQTEYYANNAWFPTAILHARQIPGTQQIMAILSGHHCHQRGKLGLIDNRLGRQEAPGVTMLAPVRPARAVRVDSYGQDGPQFQYPYPITESHFLVTLDPVGSPNYRYDRPYGIYFMHVDGRRELLAWDPDISCNQSVPLAPRATPHVRPLLVDPAQQTGVYYLQDVYRGPGLAGIERGTIKSLRVIAIEFRAAGIGETRNSGPGGGSLASTPIGVGNTSWDVKTVLGEATVYPDGSAMFEVPARTPIYFQALDAKGHMVQTMRSWSTLQGGETFSCAGCHEPKNTAPPVKAHTVAMRRGPQALEPFYGHDSSYAPDGGYRWTMDDRRRTRLSSLVPRPSAPAVSAVNPARPGGFSFPREIQPILDRHCVSCHNGSDDKRLDLRGEPVDGRDAKRFWSRSYLTLTAARIDGNGYRGDPDGPYVKWINIMSEPTLLPPYAAGAARSPMIQLLDAGHEGVKLSREEMDTLVCWIDLAVPFCGDYTEAADWTQEEIDKYNHYLAKRRRLEQLEGAAATPSATTGRTNTLDIPWPTQETTTTGPQPGSNPQQ